MATGQSEQLVIYGAGGSAREVAWLAQACRVVRPLEVVCFVDDDPSVHGTIVNGIPVMGLQAARQRFAIAKLVGGVGSPQVREKLMAKAAATGFPFATLVHPRAEYSDTVKIGAGVVICAGNILTVNIELGAHVQINLDCTVAHDAILGDYTTLAPGVHVSGRVHFGRRVYVGTGANIINGAPEEPLSIGDDAVIGAGACVIRSVAAGQTVVGVPAKPIARP